MAEKVRGLCFPYGQEGAGRAADEYCVLYLGSKQEGENDVLQHDGTCVVTWTLL